MIANGVTVLIGLWLSYGAIFSNPPGNVNNIQLAIGAVVVVGCAIVGRLTNKMSWQSSTNLALGAILAALAAARAYFDQASVPSFWVILLAGIAVAIMSLWSILYREELSTESPS
jgi:chromate transport protein ChrA